MVRTSACVFATGGVGSLVWIVVPMRPASVEYCDGLRTLISATWASSIAAGKLPWPAVSLRAESQVRVTSR
jgi:hypothetical protein